MARSLTTLSSSILFALALAASTGAVGCIAEVDSNGEPIEAEESDLDACPEDGASRSCEPDAAPGNPGIQVCSRDENDDLVWSTCEMSAGSTPLVLSFDSAPVTFSASAASFDLTGTMSVVTDWPTSATPWLALDRNGNGAIDGGSELFGSATVLRGGDRATNGFIALAELDANGDGRITKDDPAFTSLVVWSDRDGDRASSAGEIAPLASFKLVSIDVAYTNAPRCDTRGNCEIERAGFRFVDAAGVERGGTVIDVHLKFQ
jgi:hypothetical protein